MKTTFVKGFHILLFAAFTFCSGEVSAQMHPRWYYEAGWQFNIPVATDFAAASSGRGFYFDGGYYLTRNISFGGFLNYHSNSERVPRSIYTSGTASVSTDQMQSVLQLPFGMSLRYRFAERTWQPYVSAKLGANYSEAASVLRTDGWKIRAGDSTPHRRSASIFFPSATNGSDSTWLPITATPQTAVRRSVLGSTG